MVKTWNISYPAAKGRERRRRAYVYLPAMYKAQPRRRFPVLYMFDGHNLFFDEHASHGRSWRLAEYLDFTETPLIVAAVECSHAAPSGRICEYSPYCFDDPEMGHIDGEGERTMHWFIHDFKRLVDRRFRTIPWRESTFIGGSSMGGLMSLYAVLRHNDIFSRAAVLSPHIWADKNRLLKLIRSADIAPDTVIYMDWGENEADASMARDLRRTASAILERGINATVRVVPGGEHCEACWDRQAPFFTETLMYGIGE